jgi:hypothetical protein
MKKHFITLLLATVFCLSASAQVALDQAEAIAMLQSVATAQSSNDTHRAANAKKPPFPAMLKLESGFKANLPKTIINWDFQDVATRIGKTAAPNNGTIAQAYLQYSLFQLEERGYIAFYEIFNNVELYKFTLNDNRTINNRFDRFEAYLNDLADIDLIARRDRVLADIGNNFTGVVVLRLATNIVAYDARAKALKENKEYNEDRLPSVVTLATQGSLANPTAHRALLVEAFGNDTYSLWQKEFPDLINSNNLMGICAIQTAVHMLHTSDRARLDRYKVLFNLSYIADTPPELFTSEKNTVAQMRAFHQKFVADQEKAAKKS